MITIVVLLIFVAVSVATLTGQNGILTQANNAKVANDRAETKEKLELALNEWQIEKNTGTKTLDELLKEKFGESNVRYDETTGKYTVKVGDYEETVDREGRLVSTVEEVKKAGTIFSSTTTIKDGNASLASRQMYYGNSYVESDLVNSYAWDTAIFYIQAMGNENYANVNKRKPMLLNTGATGDEKCHIFDMAGNCEEYTTEYSTGTNGKTVLPCVIRGGVYADSSYYTSCRSSTFALGSFEFCSFRPLLYCKTGV